MPSSSWALVTPSTTLIRVLSMLRPRAASSSTRWATMRASSCAVSVAGTMLGGTPQDRASKSTGGKKPPRLA